MCLLEAFLNRSSAVCLYQQIVFDQDSSHCVAVSRLTSGVKTQDKKPQDVISIGYGQMCVHL